MSAIKKSQNPFAGNRLKFEEVMGEQKQMVNRNKSIISIIHNINYRIIMPMI